MTKIPSFVSSLESLQLLKGRSALWQKTRMVFFRQDALQSLKAEVPSPHPTPLPRNLTRARMGVTNTKLSDLNPSTDALCTTAHEAELQQC